MSEEKIISEVTQELNNEEQTTNYEYAPNVNQMTSAEVKEKVAGGRYINWSNLYCTGESVWIHSIYFRSSNGSVCTERISDFGQEDELERNYYMCNFDASDGIYQ